MHAIRAAHAFDGSRFLPGAVTVVIDQGRIIGVEAGRLAVPDDVELTEFAGTVLPGLIDCHTHLVADATVGGLERAGAMGDDAVDSVIADSLRAQAAAGVTTVRDLGDRDYRTLAFRDQPGLPRVVASGPPVTTPNGHCHFLGGAVTGDVRAAVAERVERGVDVIKVMASGGFATPESDQLGAQFSVAELAALVEAGHAAGLPVVAHAHSLLGIENAVSARVDGIEHFSGLTAEGRRIDDELLDRVAECGMHVDPTLGNDRRLHTAMRTPPPKFVEMMARFGFDSFDAFYGSLVEGLSGMREHGVAVVSGVDSGMGPAKGHGNAWRTVGELATAGFPVAEALAASTSVAAKACGLEGETGRLTEGYAADVLVVDGDLSDDPTLLSAPRVVLIRGTPVVGGFG
jgi:imidazolonepropionase-like amidohydrolase